MVKCYHCGDDCLKESIEFDDKMFCCHGCRTVYEIFSSNSLSYYYNLQDGAGITPEYVEGKFDFLENQDIVDKLVDFDDEGVQVVSLSIPHIHCSSCIWVLENLNRLSPYVKSSLVNFPEKTIQVTYCSDKFPLKDLVILLSKIGYEPSISLEDFDKKQPTVNRQLIYKLGLAGFAFGNVMLLSFPEYFEVGEFWLEKYKVVFRWLMFFFSVPVVAYAASDYFKSAMKGLRSGLLNIDVPIAIGIAVLFLRSTVDIIFDFGSGFFDSLTGLVFFLLLGKFFQQKTYAFLSFERDYKSYFPIAVTKINAEGNEENIQIYEVKFGDRLLVRNQEILPVDCLLLKGDAQIDYSFVTGEARLIAKQAGDKLYAGGKQVSGIIEVQAISTVSQSYLTQLWGNSVFKENKETGFQSLTDAIGRRFTIAVLSIAVLASSYWFLYDPSKVMNVFTAVLIIACPCAIALAAPFTLGNMLRIFGRHQFYLKNTQVLERLAKIDTAIFDKTGTLTTANSETIDYEGIELSPSEISLLKNTLRASNHPLSRSLYGILKSNDILTLDEYHEQSGLGLQGSADGQTVKVGSATFAGVESPSETLGTEVHISANDAYKGKFLLKNNYRSGIFNMLERIKKLAGLAILSGDNSSEQNYLSKWLPKNTPMLFNQKPEDKLQFVKALQKKQSVLMVGDGLNDAGALAQSDVGLAVSENINVFSPACDAIINAKKLVRLDTYLKMAKQSIHIIKWSFLLSLCYNVVGLYFAVTGQLEPVIAAILMPLSSISIVVFTTLATNLISRKLTYSKNKNKT